MYNIYICGRSAINVTYENSYETILQNHISLLADRAENQS